ncbi:hypothetical protein BC834DRAFT_910326 [Gloeopeniophorella convolvens]|nr:hypothetical protein BC834DRAFT_910326 [Gloeopeniophorella convolvens]
MTQQLQTQVNTAEDKCKALGYEVELISHERGTTSSPKPKNGSARVSDRDEGTFGHLQRRDSEARSPNEARSAYWEQFQICSADDASTRGYDTPPAYKAHHAISTPRGILSEVSHRTGAILDNRAIQAHLDYLRGGLDPVHQTAQRNLGAAFETQVWDLFSICGYYERVLYSCNVAPTSHSDGVQLRYYPGDGHNATAKDVALHFASMGFKPRSTQLIDLELYAIRRRNLSIPRLHDCLADWPEFPMVAEINASYPWPANATFPGGAVFQPNMYPICPTALIVQRTGNYLSGPNSLSSSSLSLHPLLRFNTSTRIADTSSKSNNHLVQTTVNYVGSVDRVPSVAVNYVAGVDHTVGLNGSTSSNANNHLAQSTVNYDSTVARALPVAVNYVAGADHAVDSTDDGTDAMREDLYVLDCRPIQRGRM